MRIKIPKSVMRSAGQSSSSSVFPFLVAFLSCSTLSVSKEVWTSPAHPVRWLLQLLASIGHQGTIYSILTRVFLPFIATSFHRHSSSTEAVLWHICIRLGSCSPCSFFCPSVWNPYLPVASDIGYLPAHSQTSLPGLNQPKHLGRRLCQCWVNTGCRTEHEVEDVR